jgi:hypothetical protein
MITVSDAFVYGPSTADPKYPLATCEYHSPGYLSDGEEIETPQWVELPASKNHKPVEIHQCCLFPERRQCAPNSHEIRLTPLLDLVC